MGGWAPKRAPALSSSSLGKISDGKIEPYTNNDICDEACFDRADGFQSECLQLFPLVVDVIDPLDIDVQ